MKICSRREKFSVQNRWACVWLYGWWVRPRCPYRRSHQSEYFPSIWHSVMRFRSTNFIFKPAIQGPHFQNIGTNSFQSKSSESYRNTIITITTIIIIIIIIVVVIIIIINITIITTTTIIISISIGIIWVALLEDLVNVRLRIEVIF